MKANISENFFRDNMAKKCFENFKVFAKEPMLQHPIFTYKNGTKDGCIAYYSNAHGSHIITIDRRFSFMDIETYEPIFFHEFTHMVDSINLGDNFQLSKITLAAEFSAARIQTLRIIEQNKNQISNGDIESIKKLIAFDFKRYKNDINIIIGNSRDTKKFIYNSAILLGEISAIYSTIGDRASEIIDFNIFPDYIRRNIINAYSILHEQKLSPEIVRKSCLIETEMFNDITSYIGQQ